MSLKSGLVSSVAYNSLPYILDVADAPSLHSKDLDDILSLFRKHTVPSAISVKLAHKHFDIIDGEVMVLREMPVSTQGRVWIMNPMMSQQAPSLRGINYIVDEDGQLQPYEFTTADSLDTSQYSAFFEDFCKLVVERGLQRKFALKVGLDRGGGDWTEFEVPHKRGNIIIPQEIAQEIAQPESGSEISVMTVWHPEINEHLHCKHQCTHSSDCNDRERGLDPVDGIYLAGKKLEDGSPLHTIVYNAIRVM